jgi:hypothetical protein
MNAQDNREQPLVKSLPASAATDDGEDKKNEKETADTAYHPR